MDTHPITEQIITNHRRQNFYLDKNNKTAVIDADRLATLWQLIVDENTSELHLVGESEREHWLSFKEGIDDKLAKATSPEEIIKALRPIVSSLTGKRQRNTTYDTYNNATRYTGDGYGATHVPASEL